MINVSFEDISRYYDTENKKANNIHVIDDMQSWCRATIFFLTWHITNYKKKFFSLTERLLLNSESSQAFSLIFPHNTLFKQKNYRNIYWNSYRSVLRPTIFLKYVYILLLFKNCLLDLFGWHKHFSRFLDCCRSW